MTLTGFFDPGGKPVATLPRNANPQVTPSASAPRTMITNGEGYFFFRDLPAGRYALAALAFGYVESGYRLRVVDVAESDKPTAANLRIQKFAAVTGRVVDEQGEPVVGIQMTALYRLATSGGTVLRTLDSSAVAVTDDRGVYRLSGLAPGKYLVGAMTTATTLSANFAAEIDAVAGDARGGFELWRQWIAGGRPLANTVNGEGVRIGDAVLQRDGGAPAFSPDGKLLTYANTFVPGTPVVADATAIELGSGEQRTVADLPLHFAPAVRVSGVLTGPTGPMPQMTVRLLPPSAADITSADPPGVSIAFTDANGAFTFLGITPGQYTLKTARVIGEAADPANPELTLWASQPITVGESDITGLTVAMRPGLRVRGRVEFKSAAGVAPESSLPQVYLVLQPIGAGFWRTGRTRSLPDGTFVSAGDPPGRYTLARPSAPNGWVMETLALNGRVLADDAIDLEASDLTGLVVTFTKNVSRVSGTVVDAKSTVDNARDVVLFPADSTLWRDGVFNDRRTRFVHASSTGAFELPDFAPGVYYIAAVGADVITNWPDPTLLDRLVAGATKFTLAPGDAPVLQLKTVPVRGR